MNVPAAVLAGSLVSARDLIQVLLVILLWAICYPLITTGLAAFPPFHFAALRSLLAGVSLLAAGVVLKRPLLPDRDTWPSLVLASLTFTALGFTGMFLAGGLVTPGLALLVGFAGIVAIAAPGLFEQSSNSTPAGIGLVLIGATGVAIGNVILKKIASQVDPVMAMAWILLLGAVPLAVAAGMLEQNDVLIWSSASIVNLLILSVFGTALAFFGWLDLLRRTDLNMLNTYTFLTPVIALLISMLFYNERLLTGEWFGVAVVVLSIFLVSARFSPLIKKGKP